MQRKFCASLVTAAFALVALAGIASAGETVSTQVSGVAYFNTTSRDNILRLVNPTTQPGGRLCAMIYVFDAHEQMQECCGCPVTNDGLRVISTQLGLTANPLTGIVPLEGAIELVSSLPNSTAPCNAALSYTTTPVIHGFITHSGGTFATDGVAEVALQDGEVGATELKSLQDRCKFIHTNGTGHGLCTCGVGDSVVPPPGAGGR